MHRGHRVRGQVRRSLVEPAWGAAEGLQKYVDPPLTLEPLGWSGDGRLVYLEPVCDCGAIGSGLYAADTATGRVVSVDGATKVTGDVTLAPDGMRVAYATMDIRVNDEGDLQREWPNRLGLVDLTAAVDEVVAVPEEVGTTVSSPVWSPDGSRLAYGLGTWSRLDAIRSADLATGTTSVLAEGDAAERPGLAPRMWLHGDLLACTSRSETAVPTVLWVLDMPSGTWREVDRAPEIEVMGWYSTPPGSLAPDEERQLTLSPDGQRQVTIVAAGEGRAILVAENGGSARRFGEAAMDALFRAADPDDGVCSAVNIRPLAWDGPRVLRLELECWVVGREPPNLPKVIVAVDIDAESVRAIDSRE